MLCVSEYVVSRPKILTSLRSLVVCDWLHSSVHPGRAGADQVQGMEPTGPCSCLE